MRKVTQRKIAELAGIKAYFFNHILHARKRCPPSLAPKLEKLTGIDRKVWVWGSREKKRAAWNKFISDPSTTCLAEQQSDDTGRG